MVNQHKVGLVFAVIGGGWHLFWSLLVALGWAQAIYNFILWAHMIHLQITVGPFELAAAVTLVIMTALIGYAGGWTGAWVWNRFHHR